VRFLTLLSKIEAGHVVRLNAANGCKGREIVMKYLLILQGTEGELQNTMTREQVEAMMEPWNRFTAETVDAGAFLAGEGLYPSSAATTVRHQPNGDRIVSDGPFAETKEQIGGFYLLECADLDEALAWAKKVPVRPGNGVEVRPVMDFTEFGYAQPDASSRAAG
jgi:hypothetical protein